jgi:hypothetical protein
MNILSHTGRNIIDEPAFFYRYFAPDGAMMDFDPVFSTDILPLKGQ